MLLWQQACGKNVPLMMSVISVCIKIYVYLTQFNFILCSQAEFHKFNTTMKLYLLIIATKVHLEVHYNV